MQRKPCSALLWHERSDEFAVSAPLAGGAALARHDVRNARHDAAVRDGGVARAAHEPAAIPR